MGQRANINKQQGWDNSKSVKWNAAPAYACSNLFSGSC